jgi:outer membrane protein
MDMGLWMPRLIFALFLFLPFVCYGDNLLQVYCQAFHCDPTFKAAYAQMLSTRENVPINRALLLPRADFHAETSQERIDVRGRGVISDPSNNANIVGVGNITTKDHAIFYNSVRYYSLTLKQPIFNLVSFQKLQTARASAKAAEAKFTVAAQDLIIRVATAYFDILKNYDFMLTREEEETSLQNLLTQTKLLFKVNLVPVTSVNEVQAKLDEISSLKLGAEIDLVESIEHLRSMIGCVPCSLAKVLKNLPLVHPEGGLDCWIQKAMTQNMEIRAATFEAIAALENVKTQAAGHAPEVNALGEYYNVYNSNPSGVGSVSVKEIVGTLSVDFPLYHGGEITAKTRQACYDYKEAHAERQKVILTVISNTRKSFKRIFLDDDKITVNRAAIVSNQQSLQTTTLSYRAGIRTILDVINAQTQLSNVQILFDQDFYDYLLQLLFLKRQIGTLCIKDLEIINSWLYAEINLKPYT